MSAAKEETYRRSTSTLNFFAFIRIVQLTSVIGVNNKETTFVLHDCYTCNTNNCFEILPAITIIIIIIIFYSNTLMYGILIVISAYIAKIITFHCY